MSTNSVLDFIQRTSSVPQVSQLKRPLKGPLRKITVNIHDPHRPDAVVNTWMDDTGIRHILGCSDFCLVRDWHDNWKTAANDIDYAAKFLHYMRVFRRLGESDTSGYYAGRAVLMPWCIQAFWDAVEYGAKYDMRWQVTHGYQYRSKQERKDFEGEWARIGQQRHLSKYIGLIEVDNEYWQNGHLRWDLDAQREEGIELQNLWRSIFNPCPFICMGAPQVESPDLIKKSMLDDYVCEIHTDRDRPAMVKHVFGTWYMEGYPGRLVLSDGRVVPGPYYVYGEPTPMAGGPDDFMGTPNPGTQIAQMAMQLQCGGWNTYFDGWDVRSTEPLWVDAPTLESFPLFMLNIPEDSCTWPPVHGGSIWHWGKPDSNHFVTVMDELWYAGYFPPKPIGKWTAYGPQRDYHGNFHEAGTVLTGEGRLNLPGGFGGAIIKGEWA